MAIVYGRRRVAKIPGLLAAILVSTALPACGEVPGATTLIPDESVHVRSLSSAVELLEDRAGKLDIAMVSQPPAEYGICRRDAGHGQRGFLAFRLVGSPDAAQ